MGSHNILSKTDRALAAYLISLGAGTADDVYPAKRSGDKTLPDTICFSSRARMDPPNSGIYIITAIVQVRTNPSLDVDESATEKKDISEQRVSATFDAFMNDVDSAGDKLADAITLAARDTGDADLLQFTVQNVSIHNQEAGFDGRGNSWTDTLELELVVCPKDVS